jgi:putative endonuclease
MDTRSDQAECEHAIRPWFWHQWFWRLTDALRQAKQRKILNPDAALGRRGEDLAHRYLRQAGLTILARNYRTPNLSGEIDIVARDRDTIVFIEVKARTSAEYGAPDRAIDSEKERRIMTAARHYASQTGTDWDHVRFDIVSIVFGKPPTVSHYADAFFAGRTNGRG